VATGSVFLDHVEGREEAFAFHDLVAEPDGIQR
jgi:hypothetical protein